jgi:hypothetical protein|nr:MAG TPA: hypothetical protein [Caudoviricetes sp.]
MIKKYEIINDRDKKRIRALRSFHVQGRYVNIGDVGGIVYDENTLSQEGNAWIFSGNLNYPSIRVGGDSIVDTNGYEADVTDPRPFVSITGTSALVGAHEFVTGKVPAAKVLAVGDVEQGTVAAVIGSTYEESKVPDANAIRLKSLIYMGGASVTVTLAGEGYEMRLLRYDAEKKMVGGSSYGNGANTSGAYYIGIQIRKTPTAATVPADITEANVSIPSTAIEAYLDINDSRLEFRYTSAMTVATKVNPANTTQIDVYKSVIDGSNLTISKTGAGAFVANILADVVKCNVRFSAVSNNSLLIGNFSNVSEIINDGSYSFAVSNATKNKINVRDCYTFAQSETVLPTSALSAAPTNMPFTFIRCNVPDGRFYHNAKIKNTYTDIDFSKARKDLGKIIGNYYMASSEVEGMYRLFTPGNVGSMLVEDYESVKNLEAAVASYNTTIYKDAYFRGKFEFAGTNVFGNKVPGHPRARVLNVQSRAVQGDFNSVIVGNTITGVVPDARFCVIPIPLRVNGSNGITVQNLPGNLKTLAMFVTPTGVIKATDIVTNASLPANKLPEIMVYVRFGNTDNVSPVTPADLAGVTVTVYNGCKIVNTGTTAVNMKGNIRVEDNATLVNASVTGSGYFGGNSVTYYNPTEWAPLDFEGAVFMKDKAVFAPTALTGACALVHMEGNAKFIGSVDVASTNLSFIMRDNAVIEGKTNTRSGVVMSGNSKVAAAGQITAASRGVLVMEDNASIEANTTVIGAITLSGNYKGNVVKTWTGERTITSVNAPEYDDNVKTEYDF